MLDVRSCVLFIHVGHKLCFHRFNSTDRLLMWRHIALFDRSLRKQVTLK